MEEELICEDCDECRKMLTDKTLEFRKLVHKISGAGYAIIGGMLVLGGTIIVNAMIPVGVGILYLFIGAIENYTADDLAEGDISNKDDLLYYAHKLAKRDKLTAKLLDIIEKSDSISALSSPSLEEATVETTRIAPMEQPELSYGNGKVRKREKDK